MEVETFCCRIGKLMSKYELTVLFATSENEVSSEKRITDLIKKAGLKVVKLDKWGTKPLAYPMNKQTKAYYLFYNLEGAGEKVSKLEREFRMDEKLLRFLLIKV